jgi:hypothetical protein
LATFVATTAETAKMAPVETSKIPAMMQMVIAQAMMPSGADWSRMLSRLRCVRKVSVETLSATKRATKASRMPRSRISNRRLRASGSAASGAATASLLTAWHLLRWAGRRTPRA